TSTFASSVLWAWASRGPTKAMQSVAARNARRRIGAGSTDEHCHVRGTRARRAGAAEDPAYGARGGGYLCLRAPSRRPEEHAHDRPVSPLPLEQPSSRGAARRTSEVRAV